MSSSGYLYADEWDPSFLKDKITGSLTSDKWGGKTSVLRNRAYMGVCLSRQHCNVGDGVWFLTQPPGCALRCIPFSLYYLQCKYSSRHALWDLLCLCTSERSLYLSSLSIVRSIWSVSSFILASEVSVGGFFLLIQMAVLAGCLPEFHDLSWLSAI